MSSSDDSNYNFWDPKHWTLTKDQLPEIGLYVMVHWDWGFAEVAKRVIAPDAPKDIFGYYSNPKHYFWVDRDGTRTGSPEYVTMWKHLDEDSPLNIDFKSGNFHSYDYD